MKARTRLAVAGPAAIVLLLIVAAARKLWTPDRPLETLTPRWAPPPSQFIALDDMAVHVCDEGRRDDPLPIVLIHGTASSLHTWQGWADRLVPQRRVIRFDRPGFGLTGPNPAGDYDMQFYADFLMRLLDRLEVRRAIVVGNSSGGGVACRFAVTYPDRTAAVVLLSPTGVPRSAPLPIGLRIAMSPIMQPILQRVLPRSQIEQAVRGGYGDPSKVTPEVVDRNYDMMLRTGNRKAFGETIQQMQDGSEMSLLARISVPTLIIWGAEDNVIPISPDAERFQQEIAGSSLVVLPGIGHVAQEEDPDATVDAFERFLRQHAIAAASDDRTPS